MCFHSLDSPPLPLPLASVCFFRYSLPLYKLQEKGQKAERFGRAVLGILLLQDIAVVPLLVLLPIIETQAGTETALVEQLSLVGSTVARGVGGLAGILVAGRFLLRPLFDVVAGEEDGHYLGGGGRGGDETQLFNGPDEGSLLFFVAELWRRTVFVLSNIHIGVCWGSFHYPRDLPVFRRMHQV